MNDFVEIEEVDIRQEIDYYCTYILLKAYLKEHPENYDCNFIKIYTIQLRIII